MRDDNVYVKDENGNYKPFGQRYDENYLPDGIWYVRHTDYGSSTTNVDNYLCGLFNVANPTFQDLSDIAGEEDIVDSILKDERFRKLTNDSVGYSLMDLVTVIVKILKDRKEKREKGI